MFSQPTAGRPAPGLGSSRLQNGKLAGTSSASSWLPTPASRNTFAQTLGGQQAPLDLSEFPSLGAPVQQQNTAAAQSMWANPSIRASNQPQQSGVQRAPNQSTEQQSQDDVSPFGPGNEAYRFGASANQLAGLAQTPSQGQGRGDDFPPLGESDRRGSILSGFSSQSGLIGQSSRFGLDQNPELALRGLGDRIPTPRGRTLTNPNPFPLPESSQPIGLGSGLNNLGLSSGFGGGAGPVGYRRNGFPEPSSASAMSPELGFNQNDPLNLIAPAPTRSRQVSGPTTKKRLSEMTPRERNGLMGLAAKLDPDHPDFSQLAVGHDLTQLGLELNRPDSTPLYATFASPFGPANQAARPAVPDFTLPAAYRVQNVPPLHTKIPSMSDEGLMAVFYTMTRDLAQELAAQELYNRDWRWHMRHRIWLQKDPSFAAPTRIDHKQERGFYIIFNVNQWRKERREIQLNYDDLEARPNPNGFNGTT